MTFRRDVDVITFNDADIRIHKVGIICSKKGQKIDINPVDFEVLLISPSYSLLAQSAKVHAVLYRKLVTSRAEFTLL